MNDNKLVIDPKSNKNTKQEFLVPSKLLPSEKKFAREVLWRGEREGHWIVDRFVAGGTFSQRSAWGFDFEIQNQETGIVVKIELKATINFNFTPVQYIRFKKTEDLPKTKIRLCGIVPLSQDPRFASRVIFWSPKFFKALPKEALKDLTARERRLNYYPKRFYWKGLGKCVDQNQDNILYELISGKFGDHGAQYRHIPLKEAYDWLYQKLIETVTGCEKEEIKYIRYNIDLSVSDEVKTIILAILEESYRPIYTDEFITGIVNGVPDYINYRNGKPFIFNTPITEYVRLKLKELEKEGVKVISYRIPNYRWISWGLKKFQLSHIPLTKYASIALDIIRIALGEMEETENTAEDFAVYANLNIRYARYILKESRKELEKAGLLIYTRRRGNLAATYALTDKCKDYFRRL